MDSSERVRKATSRVVLMLLAFIVVYFVFAVVTGLHKLGDRLQYFHAWTFVAALGLAFGNYVLRFFKWQYYLRVLQIRGVSVIDSFLTFVSGFVLTVTPGKVGEVFKSIVLWEIKGVPVERTAPIVIAERLTDVLGVVILIAAGSAWFSGGLPWAIAGLIAVGVLLLFITIRPLGNLALGVLDRLLRGRPIVRKLFDAYDSLYELARPQHLVLPTIISTGAWFLECLALWVILRGFGEHVPVMGASFFYATSTLAGALVPVPGGLGVTETLMVTLMKQMGDITPGADTGAMLLVRFATLWFAVLVGFVGLSILRGRYKNLLR